MDLSLGRAVTRLAPGQPIRLKGACGQRLSCVQGTLWITQDGDLRDTLLAAGREFTFGRDGVAVVQALGDEALMSCEEGISPRRLGGIGALLGDFVARLRGVWQLERSRRALAALSDRELQDIGVRRGQIDLLGI